MKILRAHFLLTIFIGVLLLFIGLRVYKLPSSLLFYNDMGRDFLVLYNWLETGKPPLLGPQTSALSYNQSAWYFYTLFPVYLLTQSAYSANVTLIGISLALMGWCFWYLHTHAPKLLPAYIASCWLLTIHPQVILQNRFIWNPSFLPVFLLVAYFLFFTLLKEYSWKIMAGAVSLLAMAVGFSYSALPLALVLWLALLVTQRSHWLQLLGISVAAGGIVLGPMALFELRHNFALTRLAFTGQVLAQERTDFFSKTASLNQFIVVNELPIPVAVIYVIFVSVMLITVWMAWKNRAKQVQNTAVTLWAIGLCTVMIFVTYLIPIGIQKHYVFPLLAAVVVAIATVPVRLRTILLTLCTVLWLTPTVLIPRFQPAVRTIADLQSCYANYCTHQQQPIYVSMESGLLGGYHNAPDHQYFMLMAGCQVQDIEKHQDQAKIMAVIEDNQLFTAGKSAYRELSLFGEYQLADKYQCTPQLSIQEIRKPISASPSATIYQPK